MQFCYSMWLRVQSGRKISLVPSQLPNNLPWDFLLSWLIDQAQLPKNTFWKHFFKSVAQIKGHHYYITITTESGEISFCLRPVPLSHECLFQKKKFSSLAHYLLSCILFWDSPKKLSSNSTSTRFPPVLSSRFVFCSFIGRYVIYLLLILWKL